MGILRDKITVVSQPTRTEYVTRNVTVNRQSTSEDARLLHDLENEALSKITNAAVVETEGNILNFCKITKEHNIADMLDIHFAVFKFNGIKYEIRLDKRPSDIRQVAVALSKLIAAELINGMEQRGAIV